MYFGLSEDQIFFQDNVKKFLEDNAPLDVVRNISKGEDPNQKNEIHSGIINLGINNILVPEEYGGLGLDLLFATAISQSIGGAVAPLPYCGSYVMAPIAIQIGASKSQKENIFNEMSSGNTKFGIAFSEYFGSRDSSSINFSNEKINGKTIFAIDCDYATDVLVSDANGKIGIASIEDKNIEIVDLITVDKTRTYKEIKLSNANV
jgi:Acyl-CoA dehydrogenases